MKSITPVILSVVMSVLLSFRYEVFAMPFGELRVSGPCDVSLVCRPDSAGMVFVTSGTTGGSGIDVRRADDALYINVNPSATKRVSAKVYADEQIEVVMVSKRSTLKAHGFKSEGAMSLVATTAASITVSELSAKIINVSLTGNGKIDMSDDISASSINLSLIGSGAIKVNGLAAATLNVTQRGSGGISVFGSARKCSMVGFGTGSIDASKLISAEMHLKLFGNGSIFYPAGIRVTLDGKIENIKSVKPYQPL